MVKCRVDGKEYRQISDIGTINHHLLKTELAKTYSNELTIKLNTTTPK